MARFKLSDIMNKPCIIEVVHDRMKLDVPAKGAEFDITVETRDSAHADEIGRALKDKGYALRMG